MRSRITPDLIRITLYMALMTYCAGMWIWMRIDDLLHPDEP